MLMNISIQGLFNLVSDLSGDVIGWIGNVRRSQLGRDTEGKASNSSWLAGDSAPRPPAGLLPRFLLVRVLVALVLVVVHQGN